MADMFYQEESENIREESGRVNIKGTTAGK